MNYDDWEILDLIKNQISWEKILLNDPYNIIIKKENDLVLLKYNQLKSKICHLTNQCR